MPVTEECFDKYAVTFSRVWKIIFRFWFSNTILVPTPFFFYFKPPQLNKGRKMFSAFELSHINGLFAVVRVYLTLVHVNL